jgi:hypothetical protein
MKRAIYRFLNFITNLVITVGVIVSLGTIVLQFIPQEWSTAFYAFFSTNIETVIPASITTAITTVVLGIAKYAHTAIKLLLKDSEFKQELQRKRLEREYNERLDIAEQRDFAIVEKLNQVTQLLNIINSQNAEISKYNQIVAEKNLASSIIPQKFKDDIKAWKNKEVVEKIEPITIEEVKEEVKTVKAVENKGGLL